MDDARRSTRAARAPTPWPSCSPAGAAAGCMELTDRRAKPAVYFGGKSRIIDFALSNALNSGIRRIAVATQYKAHSLIRHLQRGWNFLRAERNESFDILPASQRVDEDQLVPRHGRRGVPEHRHHRRATRPSTWSSWPATTSTRWTTSVMLAQHVDAGRRRHRRLPRGAARARRRGFGVMHVDDDDRIIDFVEKPADPPAMPGPARTWRWPRMGIYVFERELPASSSCAATPPTRHSTPRLRQGHHPVPREARQGRRAPLRALLRALARREPSAYWRDVGTVDAYWEANIDLTDIVPQLDLYDRDWPIWTYAEITPPAKFVHDEDGRRGVGDLLAGVGRLHRLGRARCGARCCSPACTCTPTRTSRTRWCCPTSTSAAARGSRNVVVDRGVRIPTGLVVGEDPVLDAAALPPHRQRRLPDHAADDRPPRMSEAAARPLRRVGVIPLVKTGGLADVVGALPAALAREGIETRTLLPGYPAVLAALRGGETRAPLRPTCSAARRGCSPRALRRARPARARRAAPLRAAGQPLRRARTAATGPTTRCASPRSASAPPRSAAARCRLSRPTSCTRTTGRPAWRPAYLHYGGTPRPAHGDHGAQPRLPGQFPARAAGRARPAARTPSRCDGVEYYGAIGFLKAGLALARPHHHRLADLRGARSAPPRAAWASTGCCARAPACCAASSTASTTAVWNPATDDAPRGRASTQPNLRAARRQQGGAAGALRPRRRAGRVPARRRQPPDAGRRAWTCCSTRCPR